MSAAELQRAVGEILIEEDALQHRIAELGQEISADYAGRDLLLVGVLKGAVFFMADLMRNLHIACEIDFMAISSYGASTDSSGVVRLVGLPAGEWLLLAWREESHAAKGGKAAPKDMNRYRDIPVMTGYAAVSYWRMRVSVVPGTVTPVTLSDRAIWLTAVREERSHVGDVGTAPKKQR